MAKIKISGGNNMIDITGKADMVRIEFYTGKIGRIFTKPDKFVNLLLATHIPIDLIHIVQNDLGNCSCPTAPT